MSDTYTIKLKQFEGPFDLLLFFIERDELDIYDIPISKITQDYLEHIQHLEELNLDVASEFILVAATLMRIKAKMLLPRKEIDSEGNEIDPREELIARLLEYKKYKSVLEEMRLKEKRRASMTARGNVIEELKEISERAMVDVELESVSLFKIMKAYERVMSRFDERENAPEHRIAQYNYTIQDQQSRINGILAVQGRSDFDSLFESCENRIHAIITFLGILELITHQRITIIPGLGANNFWVELKDMSEEE